MGLNSYEGKQYVMFKALTKFANDFHIILQGDPVFGWNDRSVGCQVVKEEERFWLRVVSEQKWWAQGDWWEGNLAANELEGVSKPKVLEIKELEEEDILYRAELHTFIQGKVCSTTPEIRADFDPPSKWWLELRLSLNNLATWKTDRRLINQEKISRRLLMFYGDDVDSHVDHWTTAHADLHWANIMYPKFTILDWEGWGLAPAGYDAAFLYCHSFLNPKIANQVYTLFQDILDTKEGFISQLYVITHLLRRIDQGDYIDLAGSLHRQARKLKEWINQGCKSHGAD